jgi:hypothetical protein
MGDAADLNSSTSPSLTKFQCKLILLAQTLGLNQKLISTLQ